MITGRVCKNVQAMFNSSEGAKESLEVKLRLVPVPIIQETQSDFFSATDRYMSTGPGGSIGGGEQVEWLRFIQSQQQFQTAPNLQAESSDGARDTRNANMVNEMLSQSPSMVSTPTLPQPTKMQQHDMNDQSNMENRHETALRRGSKQGKRGSISHTGSVSVGEDGTDIDDGPAPKKRAKITQADWHCRQSLDSAPDSLRIAASTASSLRLFRPVSTASASRNGEDLQEGPRAPTPVPPFMHHDRFKPRDLQNHSRRLSLVSQVESPRTHISPYPPIGIPQEVDNHLRDSIEEQSQSPDFSGSMGDVSPHFRSSPPVLRHTNMLPSSPPSPLCPSSPQLPPLPRIDSGFMSGSVDDLFGEDYDLSRFEDASASIAVKSKPRGRTIQHSPSKKSSLRSCEAPSKSCEPQPMMPRRGSQPLLLPLQRPQSSNGVSPLLSANSTTSTRVQSPKPELSLMTVQGAAFAGVPPSRERTATQQQKRPPASNRQPQSISVQSAPDARPTSAHPPSTRHGSVDSQCKGLDIEVMTQPMMSELSNSNRMAKGVRSTSRPLARTASAGTLKLPAPAASDPIVPPVSLQRANTTTYTELAAVVMGEAREETPETLYSRTSKAKKEANQRRLEHALSKGEMPPYCENCGAIETPTWRKAWTQKINGPPAYHEYSDLPGKVTMVVILERDAMGVPTSHMIVKKFLLPIEDQTAYNEYCLCNRKYDDTYCDHYR